MRTLTLIKPSHPADRRPDVLHDAGPLLVSKGRKTRAKMASPEPATPAGEVAMPDHERAVIDAALAVLRARLRQPGGFISGPSDSRTFALLHLASLDVEVFAVMFLDSQNALIAFEEMSRGTLTQTSVYPREIVRAALRHNAAGVIFAHNHPSGNPEPSQADRMLTQSLKDALHLVDVATHDHLIVAGDCVTSFAERGLM